MPVRFVQRRSASALMLAGLAALSLAACEEKKSFKHEADWPSPAKPTPKAIHTDTPEGTAEAVETRLDDILAATREVYSEADARKAADKMKAAYADLETYYAKLAMQEPKADGPNRQAVAGRFFETQKELAKSVADLLEKDQKIVEVIGGQLDMMPLVQDPPDPAPAASPAFEFDAPKVTPTPSAPKPKSKPKTQPQ